LQPNRCCLLRSAREPARSVLTMPSLIGCSIPVGKRAAYRCARPRSQGLWQPGYGVQINRFSGRLGRLDAVNWGGRQIMSANPNGDRRRVESMSRVGSALRAAPGRSIRPLRSRGFSYFHAAGIRGLDRNDNTGSRAPNATNCDARRKQRAAKAWGDGRLRVQSSK